MDPTGKYAEKVWKEKLVQEEQDLVAGGPLPPPFPLSRTFTPCPLFKQNLFMQYEAHGKNVVSAQMREA